MIDSLCARHCKNFGIYQRLNPTSPETPQATTPELYEFENGCAPSKHKRWNRQCWTVTCPSILQLTCRNMIVLSCRFQQVRLSCRHPSTKTTMATGSCALPMSAAEHAEFPSAVHVHAAARGGRRQYWHGRMHRAARRYGPHQLAAELPQLWPALVVKDVHLTTSQVCSDAWCCELRCNATWTRSANAVQGQVRRSQLAQHVLQSLAFVTLTAALSRRVRRGYQGKHVRQVEVDAPCAAPDPVLRTWRPMLPTTMASDAGPHMARKGEIQRPAFADDSGCTISEGLLCLAGRQIQCCGLYVTRGPQLLSSLSFKS